MEGTSDGRAGGKVADGTRFFANAKIVMVDDRFSVLGGATVIPGLIDNHNHFGWPCWTPWTARCLGWCPADRDHRGRRVRLCYGLIALGEGRHDLVATLVG
jgi:hypothetical protein